MNIDIREHIKNNFKEDTIETIKTSIDKSISKKEEESLIGLGVFFEILWNNINKEEKLNILKIIKENI